MEMPALLVNTTNTHVLKLKLPSLSMDTLALAVCTGLDSHHARIMLIRWTQHRTKYINKAFTGTLKRKDAAHIYD